MSAFSSAPSSSDTDSADPLLLFLDIDGVLNRIEDDDEKEGSEDGGRKKKKKKKEKKMKKEKKAKKQSRRSVDDASDNDADVAPDDGAAVAATAAASELSSSSLFESPLPCVPRVDTIDALLHALELRESLEPTLLHNFAHLCHAVAGCGGRERNAGIPAAAAAVAWAPTAEHDAAATAMSTDAPTAALRIVLSSTWRLQPQSLQLLQRLLGELGLTAPVPSAAPGLPAASSLSACRLRVGALDCTPDLCGWGTRLDEIFAYLKEQQQLLQQPMPATECSSSSLSGAAPSAVAGSSAASSISPSAADPTSSAATPSALVSGLAELGLADATAAGAVAGTSSVPLEPTITSTPTSAAPVQSPPPLPLRFLLLDDMDMFSPLCLLSKGNNSGGNRLSSGGGGSGSAQSGLHELRCLFETVQARTVKLDGRRGLDRAAMLESASADSRKRTPRMGALQVALVAATGAMADAHLVGLRAFAHALSSFEVPTPPSSNSHDND
jgi:hypothetical protein